MKLRILALLCVVFLLGACDQGGNSTATDDDVQAAKTEIVRIIQEECG